LKELTPVIKKYDELMKEQETLNNNLKNLAPEPSITSPPGLAKQPQPRSAPGGKGNFFATVANLFGAF
jgi:hypothetical protein